VNQEDMPLATAVIPVYNHEKYAIESIRSIVSQTYRNIELLVINDGSKDGSHEQVLSLAEECRRRFVRFEYINRENIGLSATLNQALSIAKGKYFTILASDDIAFPEKIELLVNALETKGPSYAAAFGNALFIDDKGCDISLVKGGNISGIRSNGEVNNCLDYYMGSRRFNYRGADFGTYETLIAGNYLPSMSNIIRTSAIFEVGGWTEGNIMEDWEMWLKLARTYKFFYIDRPVAYYRWHALNTAKTTVNGLTHASLLVLNGEKAFCSMNNLLPQWNTTRNSLVFNLLRKKNVPLSAKLSLLMSSDMASLARSIVRRLRQVYGEMP